MLPQNINLAIYLFICALVLAYLEVQIEGQHGWAAKLPTWRPNGKWFAKLYRKVMGGKELTGYHLGVFGFVLLFLHYPYLGWAPTWWQELWVLSIFLLFSVVWDYLWIIINPHYGVIRRRPQTDVTWHHHWWGPFPRDYYFGILLSIVLISPLWYKNWYALEEWAKIFGVFAVGTVLTLILVEMFRGDVKRK